MAMNRSFRAQDSQMQAMIKQRQQLRASVRKEKEEELALFLEMKKREKERNDLLLNSSEEFDAPLGTKPGTSPIFNISSSTPAPPRKTGADDFLNSENDKNDYDWLLTPPGTPLFPSLEMESHKTVMSQLGTPKACPTALKSRPSEMPGFSLEAPPNLRTTLPDRPLSATRGRPGAPSSRSSSVEPGPNVRPRRQSCSPSRGRAPNGISHASGSSVPAFSRGHSKVNDNVSPVLMGTKMVERVINMRKLAPPKQEDKHSPHGNHSGKSASSPDSSGFGRSLSKKSLDMAIRHMDIRRSIPGNLRPLMTNIPASSMYSVRSGPARSRTISVSDSPLATSSNASSEVSVNNNGLCLDGSEVEDNGSERGGRSPASVRGR
ncbi:unnamed protein product [Malus baccata var. baccata]